MRVLVLEDYGRMAIADRPTPVAARDEVLIALEFVGICGTDLHGYTGANGRRERGQVMGHEAAGRIVAVGEGGPVHLSIGMPVTFNPLLSCGHCTECIEGNEQRCAQRRVIGVDPRIVSAFAEYISVPASNVHPFPDNLPLSLAALVEPIAVALHAVRRLGSIDSVHILVLGGGPIGQSVVFAARARGAGAVIVSEIDPARRELCASLGATTIDPSVGTVAGQVAATWGRLADRAIDAVGIGPTYRDALAATRPGASIAVIGMGAPNFDFEPYPMITAERTMIGTYCYSNRDFGDAVELVTAAPDLAARMVSKEIPFDDAPEAFARLAAQEDVAGKVLIRCSENADGSL